MKLGWIVFLIACSGNKAEKYDRSLSTQEEAKKLMNEGAYDEAITLLEREIPRQPDVYVLRTLAAAAYVGSAGVDLLSLVSRVSQNGQSQDVFALIGDLLPEELSREEVELVARSIGHLDAIPLEKVGAEGDPEFGESALFQKLLYRSLYATMYLQLFVKRNAAGEIDLEALSQMTEDDAAAILAALSGAAGDVGVGPAVNSTLAAIEESEGASDREQLISYVSKK